MWFVLVAAGILEIITGVAFSRTMPRVWRIVAGLVFALYLAPFIVVSEIYWNAHPEEGIAMFGWRVLSLSMLLSLAMLGACVIWYAICHAVRHAVIRLRKSGRQDGTEKPA